jgi:hypothetical protein
MSAYGATLQSPNYGYFNAAASASCLADSLVLIHKRAECLYKPRLLLSSRASAVANPVFAACGLLCRTFLSP